jgi:hypothetical protein
MYKILYSGKVYNVRNLNVANGRHTVPGREARAVCVSVPPLSVTLVANR